MCGGELCILYERQHVPPYAQTGLFCLPILSVSTLSSLLGGEACIWLYLSTFSKKKKQGNHSLASGSQAPPLQASQPQHLLLLDGGGDGCVEPAGAPHLLVALGCRKVVAVAVAGLLRGCLPRVAAVRVYVCAHVCVCVWNQAKEAGT